MNESIITTHKINHIVEPVLRIWGWEVAFYLFLGGLTAGILVIAALLILFKKEDKYPLAATQLPVLAPILLSLGMFFLFLDLDHKVAVWRFYTAFKFTSPMSWGAWILLLVYPVNILLILATVRRGFPKLFQTVLSCIQTGTLSADGVIKQEKKQNNQNGNKGLGKAFLTVHNVLLNLVEWSEKNIKWIAIFTVTGGIMLGIYTGILLSSLAARPFWNSSLMGPLFLTSGLSTAAALIILLSKNHDERHFFAKLDMGLITAEMGLLFLFILGMVSSHVQQLNAVQMILGGEMTAPFWVLVVGIGLLLPLFLESLEMKGKSIPAFLSPVLILLGGVVLRLVMVEAGQISRWIETL